MDVQDPHYRLSTGAPSGGEECREGGTTSSPKHRAPPSRGPAWKAARSASHGNRYPWELSSSAVAPKALPPPSLRLRGGWQRG